MVRFFDWIQVFEVTIPENSPGYFAAIPTPPDSKVEHVEAGLGLRRMTLPFAKADYPGRLSGKFPVGIPDSLNPVVACPTSASLSLVSEIVIGVRRRLTCRLCQIERRAIDRV